MRKAEPVAFRLGDLVEVQQSMLLVLTNNHRYKSIVKLRGLALLDSKFTDVSQIV